jgi:hypothetical protein
MGGTTEWLCIVGLLIGGDRCRFKRNFHRPESNCGIAIRAAEPSWYFDHGCGCKSERDANQWAQYRKPERNVPI